MLRKFWTINALFALLIAITNCGDDDNPVETNHDEEHAEAVGLIIRNSGTEIGR